MDFDSKQFPDTIPPGASQPPQGRVKVLVALSRLGADPSNQARLRQLGMEIDGVIKNKVIGTIPVGALEALKGEPGVLEVETSVPLSPSRRSTV